MRRTKRLRQRISAREKYKPSDGRWPSIEDHIIAEYDLIRRRVNGLPIFLKPGEAIPLVRLNDIRAILKELRK